MVEILNFFIIIYQKKNLIKLYFIEKQFENIFNFKN